MGLPSFRCLRLLEKKLELNLEQYCVAIDIISSDGRVIDYKKNN